MQVPLQNDAPDAYQLMILTSLLHAHFVRLLHRVNNDSKERARYYLHLCWEDRSSEEGETRTLNCLTLSVE